MTKLRFIGRVTKMGDYRIIRIPKRYQDVAEKFGDNHVRVSLEEIL